MQKQFIKGLVTKISEEKYRVLASTSAIDRQGDSIDQSGWDISNFKLNPVMPWAHNYDELPVAKATGIEITERGLECDFEFAPAEGNPKAQQIKILYDQGYLNAVSVGFIPKERKGNTITKAELLEISFVPVPANQEALRLALKSLDISEIEADIKGAVEDELTAEEKFDMKCEKLDSVMEVISAFWKVYFDEATPVENFKPLLIETIALLQEVADKDGIDDTEKETGEEGADDTTIDEEEQAGLVGKEISPETIKSFNEFVIKEGRTLSKKTLEIINNAIESMKDTTSVLEDLKNASSEEQDAKSSDSSALDEKGVEEAPIEKGVIVLKIEELPLIRQALVAKDKTNELALSIVNNYMKSVGIK